MSIRIACATALLIVFSQGSMAQTGGTDGLAIDKACQQEALAAQCKANAAIGNGLGRCLNLYRKKQLASNPNFKFSSVCEQIWVEAHKRHPNWKN